MPTLRKMQPWQQNARRAQEVEDILAKRDSGNDDAGADITDLLSDIRHFCDKKKLDFAALDRIAYQHYAAEIGEVRSGLGD